jgi:hypothetical protein
MSNQHGRSGSDAASSNQPAEPERRHKTGGHMGAGKSGSKSMGAEKPEYNDASGTKQPGDDLDWSKSSGHDKNG